MANADISICNEEDSSVTITNHVPKAVPNEKKAITHFSTGTKRLMHKSPVTTLANARVAM